MKKKRGSFGPRVRGLQVFLLLDASTSAVYLAQNNLDQTAIRSVLYKVSSATLSLAPRKCDHRHCDEVGY
jgi:hypothetical protein